MLSLILRLKRTNGLERNGLAHGVCIKFMQLIETIMNMLQINRKYLKKFPNIIARIMCI